MLTKDQILKIAKEKGKLYSKDLMGQFKVSRQYANLLVSGLILENKLIKLGSTRKAFYVTPEYAQAHQEIFPLRYVKTFKNEGLEEHKVLNQIEETFPILKNFSENNHRFFLTKERIGFTLTGGRREALAATLAKASLYSGKAAYCQAAAFLR